MYLNWKEFYIIIGCYIAVVHINRIAIAVDVSRNLEINNFNICKDKICLCTNNTDDETGLKLQEINCKSKMLNETYFDSLPSFPPYIVKLDLSDNGIQDISNFNDNQLKILILSQNKIKTLYSQNFKHSTQLKELDLSRNQIDMISQNAFDQLKMLIKLDLSYNNLKLIDLMSFSHLPKLQDLNLSWNRELNQSQEIQTYDLFEFYGVTPFLKTLNFNGCNLEKLYLTDGTNLQNLHIANNQMHKMPELPRNIKYIDFSGNPIHELNSTFASHLFQLNELVLNDMPNLEAINEYAFFGLPVLKIINLQNCKKLKLFNLHAFGESVVRNETDTILEDLNLRGTSITTLHSSLRFAFENLKKLNLDGVPLNCDCQLRWLKQGNFTVIGICNEPKQLYSQNFNKILTDDFKCDWPETFKNIINGLIIFGILLVCITAISIVVLGLRKKNSHRRHIGSGSPYARITIEPTCENRF